MRSPFEESSLKLQTLTSDYSSLNSFNRSGDCRSLIWQEGRLLGRVECASQFVRCFLIKDFRDKGHLWAGNRFQIHTFLLNGSTKSQIPNHWSFEDKDTCIAKFLSSELPLLLIIVIMAYTQGIAWQALTQCIINCNWREHIITGVGEMEQPLSIKWLLLWNFYF